MRKRFKCFDCGEDMEWTGESLFCPLCGRTWYPKGNRSSDSSDFDSSDDTYSQSELDRIQEDNGLSDEDMANGAWIDFI